MSNYRKLGQLKSCTQGKIFVCCIFYRRTEGLKTVSVTTQYLDYFFVQLTSKDNAGYLLMGYDQKRSVDKTCSHIHCQCFRKKSSECPDVYFSLIAWWWSQMSQETSGFQGSNLQGLQTFHANLDPVNTEKYRRFLRARIKYTLLPGALSISRTMVPAPIEVRQENKVTKKSPLGWRWRAISSVQTGTVFTRQQEENNCSLKFT